MSERSWTGVRFSAPPRSCQQGEVPANGVYAKKAGASSRTGLAPASQGKEAPKNNQKNGTVRVLSKKTGRVGVWVGFGAVAVSI